ncbi:MAG TPA: penicillin-binding protein activator [Gammaproteobacteria bacterium]|jgi:outer membrane PBP1 activator LpoA protein|nr:penicillin-binding protein activator [Gammaproteobacteria bacterium]
MIDAKSTSPLNRAATGTLLAMLLASLGACVTSPPQRAITPSGAQSLEERARAAAQSGDAAAAELYARLAASATGTQRIDYLIESARSSVAHGDAQAARRRLNDAKPGANRDQQQAITVLSAGLELDDRKPQAALDLLATVQPPTPMPVLRDAAAFRAEALFQLGRQAEAVSALVEREVWLEDSAAILANQRLIWDGLRKHPSATPFAPTGDRIVDGWLALAPIATSGTADLRRSLLRWRETYTDHPAAGGLLADLLAAQRPAGFPAQVALLLPLSSPQRAAALAIRDGFLAARLRNGGGDATDIRIYDTAQGGTQGAYLRAQLEGADFIVGPLLPPDVEQVVAQAGFVPTLALNFSRTATPSLRSFYQFSLSPEDEARVIADAMALGGASTAIAFVPSSDRGRRTLATFRAEFESRGGRLIDYASYDPGSQEFAQPIMSLLNIARSNQRERRLQANLGVPIEFEPRRRQDVDAIFIAADDARAGRLIAPQLRFHFAGDIPTYATSDVYDPADTAGANELNGLIFADAPALIVPDANAADLRRDLQQYWPKRGGLMRLYGMGFDAYRLVGSLYNVARSSWPVRGMSGDLSLDADGRVHRTLPLAQFRNGRPAAYDVPVAGARSRELVGTR